MRHFKWIFLLFGIFMLWNASIVTAQFLETEVQKMEVPAAAPDFTLRTLGDGKTSLK